MKITALILATVAVTACTLPEKTSIEDQVDVLEAIVYKRDRFGNCIAILSSRGYGGYVTVSITTIMKGCE